MQKEKSRVLHAEKAFLELVSCGISGRTPDERTFASLTADDWDSIYTLARRQTV